jgi:hypothetical protein
MDNVIDFDARKPKAAKPQDQKPSPAMLEKIARIGEAFGAIGGIVEMDDDGNVSVRFFGPDGLVGAALVIADTRVIQ